MKVIDRSNSKQDRSKNFTKKIESLTNLHKFMISPYIQLQSKNVRINPRRKKIEENDS